MMQGLQCGWLVFVKLETNYQIWGSLEALNITVNDDQQDAST